MVTYIEKTVRDLKSKRVRIAIFSGIVLIMIGIIAINASDPVNPRGTGSIGSIFSPVQKVVYSVTQTFSNSFDSLLNISRIREENNQLRERNAQLMEENRQLAYIVSQSQALENEYNMLKNFEYDYVKSQIISRDPNNWFERFTIDKGENQQIKIDDIVVKAVSTESGLVQVGLVGKVVDVGYNWSKVVTINDIASSVSIKILRTNEGGVAKGTLDRRIEGVMFNQTEDIIIGDKILTSGLGEIYYPDLYIGKITKVEKTSDLLTEKITIEPAVDFERLYEVFVLKVDK
jgi:rod shape-determining protein MreC